MTYNEVFTEIVNYAWDADFNQFAREVLGRQPNYNDRWQAAKWEAFRTMARQMREFDNTLTRQMEEACSDPMDLS